MGSPSHSHAFHLEHEIGERRTRLVIALTAVMMVVEIAAGVTTHSMALLADGWHMGTHVAALSIAAFAYWYARRHGSDDRFTFGTGKVGSLGGFASAVFLAVVALLMALESVQRLISPQAIRFDEALVVASVGLVVNVASALMLHASHSHHEPSEAGHGDHNLRAAYLHVLADAVTSLTAIFALIAGKHLGWSWMDPVMGIVGSLVVGRWALGLLRDTGRVLLDSTARSTAAQIRARLAARPGTRLTDLHVWQLGPGHLAAIVAVDSTAGESAAAIHEVLDDLDLLSHLTVEVSQARPAAGPAGR